MSLKSDYDVLQHLGIILVILGLLLIVTPYITEFLFRVGKGKIHPLIYYPIYKTDGLTIGISPIICLILIILYILFTLGKSVVFGFSGG